MTQGPVTTESVHGYQDKRFERAMQAFYKGPPGVIRGVQQNDSYPGERVAPDDPPGPDAYKPLPTTSRDARQAIADAINAYLAADDADHYEHGGFWFPSLEALVAWIISDGHVDIRAADRATRVVAALRVALA